MPTAVQEVPPRSSMWWGAEISAPEPTRAATSESNGRFQENSEGYFRGRNTLYTFDGWYTAATGGTKVNSFVQQQADTIYYAHWTDKSTYSNWVEKILYTSTSLPARSGQVVIMTIGDAWKVVIMTIGDAWKAVGGENAYSHFDPVNSYTGSTYHLYAINDDFYTNDSNTNNTIANLKEIGADYFSTLPIPTSQTQRFNNAGGTKHYVFGGPLKCLTKHIDESIFCFFWWYEPENGKYTTESCSANSNYWGTLVPSSTPVVVVHR